MQYGMLIDYSLCTGCKSCEVSCRKEKDLPLDEWGILVNQIGALDQTVCLVADADADFVIGDLYDFSGQRLSGPDPHQSRFDFCHEVIVVFLFLGWGQVLVFQFAHACDNLLK